MLYECPTCSSNFLRYSSQVKAKNPYCSVKCRANSGVRRANQAPNRYSAISHPGHPLANKTGRVQTHRFVLYEKIGPGPHPCHWCGATLFWVAGKLGGGGNALVPDHLDGMRRNNLPENLVASCQGCNSHRSHPRATIQQGELFVIGRAQNGHARPRRATERICHFCGNDFLAVSAGLKFRPAFFCSQSCAGKDRHRRPGGFNGGHGHVCSPSCANLIDGRKFQLTTMSADT